MKTTSEHRSLGELWESIQSWLFPMLEDEIGELDEKHRQFVAVCELCAPQDHMAAYRWVGNGCPPSDRLALCKAFIAKAVWNFATTRDLIDAIRHRPTLRRLCGWETLGEVPSEATFSRAFDAFARDGRPQRIHEALLEAHYGDKLAGHVNRDPRPREGRGQAPSPAREEARQARTPPQRRAPDSSAGSHPAATAAQARPLRESRRSAPRMRLGLQAQQPGQDRMLARLQGASGRDRRRHPRELHPHLRQRA